MPAKTYSVLDATIESINYMAENAHHTQGQIIDIAVAELASKSIAADGGVDLPAVKLPARIRKPRKMSSRKKLLAIPGIARGAKGLVN